MVQVAGHLSAAELQAGWRGSKDATLARHYQVIWLLSEGRSSAEVTRLTGFVRRWVEQLLVRYNAFGPSSLGDRRRGNGARPTILTPEILDTLKERLKTPPDDGGVWTAKKVAAVIAAELGVERVAEQRGWEALRAIGYRSSARGRAMCGRRAPSSRRSSKEPCRGGRRGFRAGRAAIVRPGGANEGGEGPEGRAERHPGAVIETFATDEHRIGLKPITRRVWAPRGERPIAPYHHRFEWLYVTAFVSPATGESFWYLASSVDKALFEETLALFAREAGAGRDRIIILVLDGTGWYTAPGLAVPEGIRLVHLPPYTPELQPAETLWVHVDEPIVNKHFDTLAQLDAPVAAQCVALNADCSRVKGQAGFHWWPARVAPN